MKNVTIALDDGLLRKSREYASTQGKTFNDLVRELLQSAVDDSSSAILHAFGEADQLAWRLSGPIPSREERNAR